MVGPFVRVLAQIAVTAGGHLGRAIAQAYREAAAGRTASGAPRMIRRRMSPDEAQKILEVDAGVDKAKIEERVARLHELNQPSGDFAGSPYLQDRFAAAQAVLLGDSAAAGAKDAKGNDKTPE
mmetsp:Transcript_54582/g.130216  ORF Transcript_54582/g.130216 Transcript_54582/m.130216 type:complete len:123 (-) Transcript_54582:70-438(-)